LCKYLDEGAMSTAKSRAAYRRQVDRWVCDALDNGAENFDDLVSTLPGVFPTTAADSLRRLAERQEIGWDEYASAMRRRTDAQRSALASPSTLLPPPHPLDFDWRYTTDTTDQLVDWALNTSPVDGSVALLGTPSVFLTATVRSRMRTITLLNNQGTVLHRLMEHGTSGRLLACDLLRNEPPVLQADVVIADPPWYPEHGALCSIWRKGTNDLAGGWDSGGRTPGPRRVYRGRETVRTSSALHLRRRDSLHNAVVRGERSRRQWVAGPSNRLAMR
jgi:hypothetical protein